MANPQHLNKLHEGVADWNKWVEANPYPQTVPDLSGAELQEMDLPRINLRRPYLHCAHLDKANLQGANLWKADLGQAELRVLTCVIQISEKRIYLRQS